MDHKEALEGLHAPGSVPGGDPSSQPFWLRLAGLALLLAAVWLPRGLALDRLVTPDETRWLTRSGNFYHALVHGDFANTYQWDHPGVTTMWIGTVGFLWRYPAYVRDGPGEIDWWKNEVGPFLQAHGHEPLELLVAGRSVMVIVNTLVLGAAFLAAAQLLGFWPALAGFLFIAADPFHIALSRLLHLDGLSSSLVLLALLFFLKYLYRGRNARDFVLSAVAAGLAWLTKSPNLFLIPFVGLLLLTELISRNHRGEWLKRAEIRSAAQPLILWGVIGLTVFVLLWPAMWVDPFGTVWRVLRATAGYAVQGHEAPLYFNGAVFDGDPGALFYPVTFLWRTTPTVLAGLGLAILALAASRARMLLTAQRRPLAALLLFAALFMIFLSLGAKKFDRYLLPIYPPLALAAGVGWVAAARGLYRRWSHPLVQAASPAILLLALAGQITNTASAYPYYLSYYNPLLGGTTEAPEVMMVGWGEGLDQAARYLNSRPDAERLRVSTGAWTNTFSYFFKGQVQENSFDPGSGNLGAWMSSDYYVLYINQQQRGELSGELLNYFEDKAPELVVRIQGLDYVTVYDIRHAPPPDYLTQAPAAQADSRPRGGSTNLR